MDDVKIEIGYALPKERRYVAEFSDDKCRMIPVPNPRPGKEKGN